MTFIAEFLPLIANGGIRGHAPGFHDDKGESVFVTGLRKIVRARSVGVGLSNISQTLRTRHNDKQTIQWLE
jgi:hypothetical protein